MMASLTCNLCKKCQLLTKFTSNASCAIWWPILQAILYKSEVFLVASGQKCCNVEVVWRGVHLLKGLVTFLNMADGHLQGTKNNKNNKKKKKIPNNIQNTKYTGGLKGIHIFQKMAIPKILNTSKHLKGCWNLCVGNVKKLFYLI